MAIKIHCICGSEIECERLDLMVTLQCPTCKHELTLEFPGQKKSRRVAALTVIEGMHGIGNQYILPVNEDLVLGSAEGGWLVLREGEVASDHCRIRMDSHGVVSVFNLGAPQGTWIDQLRVIEGVLEPGHDLRLGFYRLRLTIQNMDELLSGGVPTVQEEDPDLPPPVPLVMMKTVDADETPVTWLVTNRFQLSRWGIVGLGVLGILQAFPALRDLYLTLEPKPNPYILPCLTVLASIAILRTSRRVTLAEPKANIAVLVCLAILATLFLCGSFWLAAAGVGLVALAVGILTFGDPQDAHALGASVIGLAGIVVMIVTVVQRLMIPAAAPVGLPKWITG